MADNHKTFEGASEGASMTSPMQCSALRKDGHVLFKGKPCKIVEMSTSTTGKHGHSKVNLVGIDIFTGIKYEDIVPSTHNMSVPHVTRVDYQLANISEDGYAELIYSDDDTRKNVKLEGEVGQEIKEKFHLFGNGPALWVTVLQSMGMEKVISYETVN